MTTAYPYIMFVDPALGVKPLQEFVALARSQPGKLNYETTGVGAANHLVAELFDTKAGIALTHIPPQNSACVDPPDYVPCAGGVPLRLANPYMAPTNSRARIPSSTAHRYATIRTIA